jgi:hypothetical protein
VLLVTILDTSMAIMEKANAASISTIMEAAPIKQFFVKN